MIQDLPESDAAPAPISAFVISMSGSGPSGSGAGGTECDKFAFGVLKDLRSAGIPADGGMFGQSLKSQMRMADKSGAVYAVIVGEEEIRSLTCTLKNLKTGKQENIPLSGIVKTLGHTRPGPGV